MTRNALTWKGKTFTFDPTDRVSKADAFRQLELYAAEKIAKLEKLARKTLSADELENGIEHARTDFRTRRELESWQPVFPPEAPKDGNPFRGYTGSVNQRETREQLMRRAEREWDESHAEQAPPDPERLAAIQVAEAALERTLFDPDLDEAQVLIARNRVAQAKHGTLDHFRAMMEEFNGVLRGQRDKRKAELEQRVAELHDEYPELKPEPAPQPVEPWRQPPEAPKYVRKLSLEETRKWDEERRAREAAAK